MSSDNNALLVAVRTWAARNYPGCAVRKVKVWLHGANDPIQLVDSIGGSQAAQGAALEPELEEDSGSQRSVSACVMDILDLFEREKRPLTLLRAQALLERAGKIWSKRTLEHYLSELVKDGTLIAPPRGTKPPGYRLVEWESGQ